MIERRRLSKALAHKKPARPKKRMGRPPTGFDPSVTVRIPQEMLDQVAARVNETGLNRSTVIVGLLACGLAYAEGKTLADAMEAAGWAVKKDDK
jgi:hypothetical protein